MSHHLYREERFTEALSTIVESHTDGRATGTTVRAGRGSPHLSPCPIPGCTVISGVFPPVFPIMTRRRWGLRHHHRHATSEQVRRQHWRMERVVLRKSYGVACPITACGAC